MLNAFLVEEIEDTKVAYSKDKSSAIVSLPKPQRARLLHNVLAAEFERLLYEDPGMVNLGSFGTSLLQCEVLDGSAQPPELGERVL
jgi:hypothetical protein